MATFPDRISVAIDRSSISKLCQIIATMSYRQNIIKCLTRNASMKLPVRSSRSFATTSIRQVKIAELSKRQLADIKIDQDRLWAELHKTCEWGKGERWGE